MIFFANDSSHLLKYASMKIITSPIKCFISNESFHQF